MIEQTIVGVIFLGSMCDTEYSAGLVVTWCFFLEGKNTLKKVEGAGGPDCLCQSIAVAQQQILRCLKL